jgi:hypothetical protein
VPDQLDHFRQLLEQLRPIYLQKWRSQDEGAYSDTRPVERGSSIADGCHARAIDGARDDAAKGAFVKYRICSGSDAGTLHSLR